MNDQIKTMNKNCSFSVSWFGYYVSEGKGLLGKLKGIKVKALEIGAFEGCSTIWLLDEIITHLQLKIIAIESLFYLTFLDLRWN